MNTPRLTFFRVLDRIRYKSVYDANELCFRDQIACCLCKVRVLVESLNGVVMKLQILDELQHRLGGVTCV